jgi:hypothetical protein
MYSMPRSMQTHINEDIFFINILHILQSSYSIGKHFEPKVLQGFDKHGLGKHLLP